jgi:hypothetical protein
MRCVSTRPPRWSLKVRPRTVGRPRGILTQQTTTPPAAVVISRNRFIANASIVPAWMTVTGPDFEGIRRGDTRR